MQAPGKQREAGEQPRGPGGRTRTSWNMTPSTRTRTKRSSTRRISLIYALIVLMKSFKFWC